MQRKSVSYNCGQGSWSNIQMWAKLNLSTKLWYLILRNFQPNLSTKLWYLILRNFQPLFRKFYFFISGRETCSDSILLEPFRIFANFLGSWVVRRLVGQRAYSVLCVTVVWVIFGGFVGFRTMSGAGGIVCGLPYGSGILGIRGFRILEIKGLANQDFRKFRLFALDFSRRWILCMFVDIKYPFTCGESNSY